MVDIEVLDEEEKVETQTETENNNNDSIAELKEKLRDYVEKFTRALTNTISFVANKASEFAKKLPKYIVDLTITLAKAVILYVISVLTLTAIVVAYITTHQNSLTMSLVTVLMSLPIGVALVTSLVYLIFRGKKIVRTKGVA